MALGNFEIVALQDGSIEMDAALFKNGDPDILKKYMPEGKLAASVNAYLVKTKTANILIDAGSGNSKLFKGNLLEKMDKAGIGPEDIDMVLITHAHFDHVAGLTRNGGAAFPKAKILFAEEEMATFTDTALQKLPADISVYYEPANRVLKIYKGRVKAFKVGATITEGIASVDLSGHTPGQVGYLLESGGEKLLVVADLIHVAAVQFPHPEYSLVYDADVKQAVERRRQVLNRVATEKWLIAGMHIPFPGIGSVVKNGTGFDFVPIKE
jgi:glyoxylase-like metal-dependent hydrolase (beta-lactamase superfamily II)